MDKKLIEQIKTSTTIKVCNYSQSFVATSTRYKNFTFDRVSEDGIPSYEYLSWDEIFEINSKSKCFKTGTLIIEDDNVDAMYELLGVKDWRNTIYTESDIYTMATDSSEENLNHIIGINSLDVMERLRACYTRLSNEENGNATVVVGKMIDNRYKEIVNGKQNSQLSVSSMTTSNQGEETRLLKEENKLLKEQLNELTVFMQQFKKNVDMQSSMIKTEKNDSSTKSKAKPLNNKTKIKKEKTKTNK